MTFITAVWWLAAIILSGLIVKKSKLNNLYMILIIPGIFILMCVIWSITKMVFPLVIFVAFLGLIYYIIDSSIK